MSLFVFVSIADASPAGPPAVTESIAPVEPVDVPAGQAPLVGFAVIALWALASVWWIGSRRLATLRDTAPAPSRVPPSVFVFCGLSSWLAGMFAGGLALLALGTEAGAPPSLLNGGLVGLASQVGTVGAAVCFFAMIPALMKRDEGIGFFGTRASVGRGVGAFVLVAPLIFLVSIGAQQAATLVAQLMDGAPPERLAHVTLVELASPGASSTLGWWLTIFVVTVGAPVSEEIVYRGFLQTGLSRLSGSRWIAIALTTLVFVSVHIGSVEWQAMIPLAALSVAMGVAYARTGVIWVPIVVHALFNAMNVAMALV